MYDSQSRGPKKKVAIRPTYNHHQKIASQFRISRIRSPGLRSCMASWLSHTWVQTLQQYKNVSLMTFSPQPGAIYFHIKSYLCKVDSYYLFSAFTNTSLFFQSLAGP